MDCKASAVRKMFGGSDAKPIFPAAWEESQVHYTANNATTQLQLFENFPAACHVDAVNYTLNQPNKRSRDADVIGMPHKLQISLNNFCQDDVDCTASIPNPNPVSTGLRLSYDDDEHNSSISSGSGNISSLPVIMCLDDNLRNEFDRQKEEFDNYIRIQEAQIMKGVKEMKQRHTVSFLNAIERGVGKKLQEKELEIENMNRKNRELVERIKNTAMEAQSWQRRAQYNESMVRMLQSNLKQALAQGAAAADQGKEGCGDSEVDDAASSFNPNPVLGGSCYLQTASKGLSREQMTCKSCKAKEISMLLIPCRHLCLCVDCAGYTNVCPICHCANSSSVQVFMT
ncbi:E3 ubiquitin-protein ligase BOI [Dendrobium catenatum]|uniref:RING-type domain-containing protein n=1 Tax=Dendrobium catenatum TaxID=906689 RepID=A0A2I0WCK7_9ASPA|nr:E3 ubiquitin-protein ligase BOI [Dendrobium catenatum]XP_028553255.1 E3 ubiquitin-protein ligase BOI [Dendrobium catenatum]PKU73390.1 hypothetical protein MA16_Dca024192 [Dendrobium catenatum]